VEDERERVAVGDGVPGIGVAEIEEDLVEWTHEREALACVIELALIGAEGWGQQAIAGVESV
jgi:hypothetical protein